MEGRIIIIGTKTAINIKIKLITRITTITVPASISLYIINHVILYIIRKAIDYGTIPKKYKKSLKLSLGLLMQISLVNLITDLINDLINILWTIRMMILT